MCKKFREKFVLSREKKIFIMHHVRDIKFKTEKN